MSDVHDMIGVSLHKIPGIFETSCKCSYTRDYITSVDGHKICYMVFCNKFRCDIFYDIDYSFRRFCICKYYENRVNRISPNQCVYTRYE